MGTKRELEHPSLGATLSHLPTGASSLLPAQQILPGLRRHLPTGYALARAVVPRAPKRPSARLFVCSSMRLRIGA